MIDRRYLRVLRGRRAEIGNDADDLVPLGRMIDVALLELHVPYASTDRIAAAEHVLDERLVDDHYVMVGRRVLRSEHAAVDRRGSEHVEEVGRDVGGAD